MKNSTLINLLKHNSARCCCSLFLLLFLGLFSQAVSAQGSLVPACNLIGPLEACAVADPNDTSGDMIINVEVARSGTPNLLNATTNLNFTYSFSSNSAGAFIRSYGNVVYNSTLNKTTQTLVVFPGTTTPEFNLQLNVVNTSSSPNTICECSKSVSVSKVGATASFTPITCAGGLSTLTVVGSFSDVGIYSYTLLPSGPTNSDGIFPGLPGSEAGISYTVAVQSAEECLTTISQIITQPAVIPILLNCPPETTTNACLTQDAINSAFNAWLNSFSFSGGTNSVSVRSSLNPTPPARCGGSTQVTWTVTDDCGQSQFCTRTFAVPAPPSVVLTCPTSTTTAACQTQTAVNNAYAAWLATASASGGCNGNLSNNSTGAPPACGGSKTVTFTYTSTCVPLSTSCQATFTVTASSAVVLNCPSNQSVSGSLSQAAIDTAYASWLASATASGGCGGALTNNSTGAPTTCGTSKTVTFSYSNSCGQPSTCQATFSIEKCAALEGCTLGYWKNHTNRWCGAYRTCDRFGNVFTSAPASVANLTLLQALNLGGGGVNNLARQAVAALLSACSNQVAYAGYGDNPLLIIAAVNSAFANGGNAPGTLATQLDNFNNAGCPLGGTSATSVSNCTPAKQPSNGIDVKVYPNPSANNFKINVLSVSEEDIHIKVFDMLGKTIDSRSVRMSDIDALEIGNNYSSGIYNIVITQGTEVKTQRVIKR